MKRIVILLAAGAVLGAAVVGYVTCRGCGGEPRSGAVQPATPKETPPGWTAPPEKKTTPALKRILPTYRPTRADVVLKPFPPGSRVVEVQPEGGPPIQVGILPGGEVVVPEGVKAVVYETPPAAIALEARPWVGGGAEASAMGVDIAGAGGVDLVRVWRFHAGPGVVASRDNVAGVVAGGVNLWRNVDARAGGGYGLEGATAFVGVSIAIR